MKNKILGKLTTLEIIGLAILIITMIIVFKPQLMEFFKRWIRSYEPFKIY